MTDTLWEHFQNVYDNQGSMWLMPKKASENREGNSEQPYRKMGQRVSIKKANGINFKTFSTFLKIKKCTFKL